MTEDGYFHGSSYGKLELLFLGVSLVSTDGKLLGYYEGIKLGYNDGKCLALYLECIWNHT